MAKGKFAPLPDKYRAVAALTILLIISLFGHAQTYQPGTHVVVNDAVSPVQATPLDARSQFYDAVNFRYRWFQSTSEVLSYLNTSTYRTGNFIIIVDSGGTLQSNGTYINGTATFYMFKDSTTNAGLIKLNLLGSSGCSGCLLAANNLSDLSNLTTALTNLGLNNVNNTSDAQKFAAVATLTNKTISGLSNTFSNIPVSALSQNSIGLSVSSNSAADIAVTTTPAQLGTSLALNIPTASATDRGALSSGNWSFFNGKLDSVHFSNDSLYNCVNGVCSFAGIASGGGGGSGTVQNLTVNPLSPLFTVSVATPTTTPVVTFTLSNAAAYTVFGDSTGSSAAPFYYKPNAALLNTWFGGTLQGAVTLTTTGSSGAATLVGNTLNIPVYTTGSGGSTNSNIGSGYRWAVPTTNNIKTVFGSLIIWDSTTNTNALTATADTSSGNQKLATQGFVSRSYQPTGNYITGLNGDVSATGPGLVSATIQPLAVTTGKIAANAVTLAKMAPNTTNSLLGYDNSGNPQDVTVGNLSPLFTAAISSGVFTFTQSTASSYTGYGNWTSSTAAPTFGKIPYQAFATGTANNLLGYDGSGNPINIATGTNIAIGSGTISTTANVTFTNLTATGTVNLTGLLSGGSTDSVITWNPSTGKVGVTSRLFTLYVYNYGASGLGTIFASGGDSIIGKKLFGGTNITLTQNADSSITIAASGGGSSSTRILINSGTSYTVTGTNNQILTFNFSAPVSAFTLMLPSSPVDQQTIEVEGGGGNTTLLQGQEVVWLTVIDPNYNVIMGSQPITTLGVGDFFKLKFNNSTASSVWQSNY